MMASDPDYAVIAELQVMICVATNPHMSGMEIDMDTMLLGVLVRDLKDAMETIMLEYQELPQEFFEIIHSLTEEE
jgi:hypothetical protein